jgi:3-oxoacyl-[acyl-carrier-protein] synthase II
MRIDLSGLGLITPLGNSVEQTWNALLAGEFIRDHTRLTDSIEKFSADCAKQAIAQAGWSDALLSDPQTALIVGTSKGPIKNWIQASSQQAGPLGPGIFSRDPDLKVRLDPDFGLSNLASDIAREIGHTSGPRATYSAACASGIHALIHATLLIRGGQAKRAIVVAAEASVHPLFIASFKRLGVSPPEGFGCRPFDLNRSGFLVSEAAAAVCIEASPTARPFASIENFALGGDATHITGGDPEGRTLKHLLKRTIAGNSVDLIHAHATGTQFNDPVELSAIESAIDDSMQPNIYSHKGAIGHSLGAAGLVSVVFNCISHRTGIIPPNVQIRRALPSEKTRIQIDVVERPIHRSIAIAAGFGGAVATISLRST